MSFGHPALSDINLSKLFCVLGYIFTQEIAVSRTSCNSPFQSSPGHCGVCPSRQLKKYIDTRDSLSCCGIPSQNPQGWRLGAKGGKFCLGSTPGQRGRNAAYLLRNVSPMDTPGCRAGLVGVIDCWGRGKAIPPPIPPHGKQNS